MKKNKSHFEHRFLFMAVILICIVFLILVHFGLNKTRHIRETNSNNPVTILNDFEYYDENLENRISSLDDLSKNSTLILKCTIPTELEYNSALGFYSAHNNIRVYVNKELIYEFSRNSSELLFGTTPGYSYNVIYNIYDYAGQDIYISIDSPYSIVPSSIPTFYIGDTASILANTTIQSCPTILTSLILIILGSAAILIWLTFKTNITKSDFSLLYAGTFCILLSLWTIVEQPVASYLLVNSIITSYMSSILLMLVPIALILFFRELCKGKQGLIWDVILYTNYLNVVCSIAIQVLNLSDIRNTLTVNIVIFTISMVIALIYSAYVTYHNRSTAEGKIQFVCVIILLLAYSLYAYNTYNNKYYSLYTGSIFAILCIVLILIAYVKRSLTIMVANSEQAEFYENLAYKDSLTGLFNRLAYDRAISAVDVNSASYIIVIFDLNNLKFFNDTYGHNIGDTYIKDSSNLIQQAFKNLGNVYRIGGDEFCIILKEKSIFQYETAVRELDTFVYNYNKVSDVLKINIAYGYALYDSKIDRDIYETRNRADAMMYEKKFYMKQNQVPLI